MYLYKEKLCKHIFIEKLCIYLCKEELCKHLFKEKLCKYFSKEKLCKYLLIRNSGKSMLRHEAAAKSSLSFLFIKNNSVTISRLTY